MVLERMGDEVERYWLEFCDARLKYKKSKEEFGNSLPYM